MSETTETKKPDTWFAVAGQEFGVIDNVPVAFRPSLATVMTEPGTPFSGHARALTPVLLTWMKMKRAMLKTLISRMDRWITLAEPIITSLDKWELEDEPDATPAAPPAEPV